MPLENTQDSGFLISCSRQYQRGEGRNSKTRRSDVAAITYDPLRMRNAVTIRNTVDLDESHFWLCPCGRM